MLPYLARALTVEEYGTYGQVLLIASIVNIIFSVGLAKVIFVQFAKEKDRENDVFISNLILSAIMGIIGAFLVFAFSSYLGELFNNESVGYLIKYYIVYVVFIIISASLNSTLIHFEKVKILAIIGVGINLFRIVLLFIAIQYFHSLLIALCSLVVTGFLEMTIKLFYIPKKLFFGRFDKLLSIDQLKIGIPLGITGMLSMIFKYTDGLMVSSLLTPKEYAYFRMGAIDIPLLSTIYVAVMTIVLPEVTKLFAEGKIREISKLKQKAITNSVALIYPTLIFILLFGEAFITLYLGEKYSKSVSIFILYNIILFIRVNDYRDVLIAALKTKTILYYVIISLILNILLNFVLIYYFNLIGAVIASIISFYFLAFILLRKTIKLLDAKYTDFFDFKVISKVFLISLLSALSFYGIYTFINYKLIAILFYFIYIPIVYSFIIYHKLMDLDLAYRFARKIPLLGNMLIKYFRRIEKLRDGK